MFRKLLNIILIVFLVLPLCSKTSFIYADEDDYWPGNTDTKLILTLTNLNNQVSGEVEIDIRRSAS